MDIELTEEEIELFAPPRWKALYAEGKEIPVGLKRQIRRRVDRVLTQPTPLDPNIVAEVHRGRLRQEEKRADEIAALESQIAALTARVEALENASVAADTPGKPPKDT